MGYLLHILLAVGALTAAEGGVSLAEWPAPVAFAFAAVPYALAFAARRAGEQGRFRRAARLARLGNVSPPLSYAGLVLCTDWLARVRSWTGADLSLDAWPEVALAVVFAPYVLFQLAGIHAEARAHDPRAEMRRRVLAFQVRMFLSALLPLALYVGLSVAIGLVPGWREHVEQVALFHASFVLVLMVVLAMFLPTLLANTWETVPLPAGAQRDLLDAVARRADFHPREVRIWRTGNLMANAAILGMGDRRRVVLFSDSLLSMLGPGELAAVYAHEIGHAKRRHVAVFLAWAMAFFLLGDLLSQWLAPEDPWAAGGILLAALGLWGLGFGWLSRRCELEADLYGVELLGDPGAMASALERVGGRLRDVAGWRHFSTTARVDFLWRAWREPAFARRFRARLRRLAWLGGVACLVAIGLQGRSLVLALPEDLVAAELAMGRWDRALERTHALEEPDPEWIELLGAGAARQGERETLDAAALARELEEELASGASLSRLAETALLLAVLRPSLDAVAEALQAAADDDAETLERALADCVEPWRSRLAGRLD